MAPPWLSAVAKADIVRQSRGSKLNPDQVLVVCDLRGGNDGLNTVVPFTNQDYYKARPTLGIPADQVLKLDEALGFHPVMTGLRDLYQKGQVAVVMGAGYPNPNLSHFKSMDIWQSASPDGRMKNGWIGRAFDLAMQGGPLDPIAGMGLSTEKPRALMADRASIPCFAGLSDIQNMVGDPDAEKMLREIQGMDAMEGSATRAIQQANKSALDAMAVLKSQLSKYNQTQQYGDDAFGRGFKQIAQLVATSPQTRVIYFAAGGFDTHARQADAHSRLLKGFSDAMSSFMTEMEACGKADKVLVLAFSEFGRRTYENGSAGTDHGKAAPMFLIGKKVKGGLYGPRPDFANLDSGDLRFAIDFRQLYATALDSWMGSSSEVVLAEKFAPMNLLK
jgi:uncharacterized protein (DUF1501 family)